MKAEIARAWLRQPAFHFWLESGYVEPQPLQDLCDALYVLRLIGEERGLAGDAPDRFAAALKQRRLAADLTPRNTDALDANVHLTAYALGTLNLLAPMAPDVYHTALRSEGWRLDEIVNLESGRPVWPKAWSHHSWRVSHWVGGACSILASLSRAMPQAYAASGAPSPTQVLEATDSLIDSRTGFLKCYKSGAVHAAFNTLYGLRHDPIAGEVGGIVHVHWVNHALERMPYKAAEALSASARKLLEQNSPFMEGTPYCLDFDVVQIARTSISSAPEPAFLQRAARFAEDLVAFFNAPPPPGYGIHRLPGALATLHECALIAGAHTVEGLGVAPIDIIAEAYWI